jgi:hypothetical protein
MKPDDSNYGAIQEGEPPYFGNLQECLQAPAGSVDRRVTGLILAVILGLVVGITFTVLLYVRLNSLNLLNGQSKEPTWVIAMSIITAAWTFLYSISFAIAARARYRRMLAGAAVLAVAIYLGVYGYVFFVEPDVRVLDFWCFAIVYGPGVALGLCVIFGMGLVTAGAWIRGLKNTLTRRPAQVATFSEIRSGHDHANHER